MLNNFTFDELRAAFARQPDPALDTLAFQDRDSFTEAELARYLSIKRRNLEGWIARGVILPVDKSPGTGTSHRISLREAFVALGVLRFQEELGDIIKPGKLAALLRNSNFPCTGRFELGRRSRAYIQLNVVLPTTEESE